MRPSSALVLLASLLPVLAAIPTAPAVAPGPAPPSASWSVEPVALFGGSSPPQIAVDSSGSPQVLYCPVGESWWSVRTDSGWAPEFVTATPGGGGCGGLAQGPGDMPHVYMYSKMAGGPAAARLWSRIASAWSSVPGTVPSGSIAVDSAGRVHMVAETAAANGGTYDHYLHYAVYDGAAWQVTLLDFMGTTGFAFIGAHWEQVVVDATDNPRILYYDQIRGDVRYAIRDAAGWHVEVVEHIGFVGIGGREGSLALDAAGTPYAAYTVRLSSTNTEVRYAVRSAAGWAIEVASEPPPSLGGRGQSPTLGISPSGPVLLYRREWWRTADGSSLDEDLLYASRTSAGWVREVAYDGEFLLNAPADPLDDVWNFAQFPTMVLDRCGNPHVAMYLNHRLGTASNSGAYYATKGACDPTTATAALRVEPRTLNLRSKGSWITVTVTLDGATTADVDLASLAVNGVAPDKVQVLNATTLQLKVSREDFMDTLPDPPKFGVAVAVTLTGTWKGGGGFTATDAIRVLRPGR